MRKRSPGRDDTERTRRRYDRLAPIYDAAEWAVERRAAAWRRALWASIREADVLELGIGTGRNLPYHPTSARVTGLDLSPRMLERARRRAARLGSRARLEVADAQALPHPDASFDIVVATFFLCTVPDPNRALAEARRVLRPGGRLLLLEHVRPCGPWLGPLMRRMNPLARRLFCDHLDRDAVAHLRAAGFTDVRTTSRWRDVIVQIEAVAP